MVRRSPCTSRGFTLIELLAAVSIVALLAIIVFPVLDGAASKALQVEAMTGLETLASGLETRASDGHFGYTDGAGACPGSRSFAANEPIPDLGDQVLQGTSFRYRVTASDPNGDGTCERYELRAEGLAGTRADGLALSLDRNGVKSGDWR